jgi:putative MATE family efflux protein
MDRTDLTQGDLKRHFLTISIPASIGFLFNTLFNVVDSFYAGRLGTDVLAGMAISFPIFFLIIALSSGVGNGATALTAIAIGRKDKQRFHQIAKHAIVLAVGIGVLLPLLSPWYLEPLFRLAGAEGTVLDVGLSYTGAILIGAVFFLLNFVLNGILQAQGNTKPFRNTLLVGFLANLVLDPLFIFGWVGLPALGVAGVALATILIQGASSVYLFFHVWRSPWFDPSMFRTTKWDVSVVLDILGQGIPAALSSATIALGVFVINYFVLWFGGSDTVAAYGVSMRIEQLALIPTIGLNIAVLSIVGQNYGAGDAKRIREARKRGMLYGAAIMLLGTVVIVPLAPYLISFFDDSEAVVQAGATYLRIEAVAFTTYVFLNINISTLQGIKRPRFAIWIGLYRQVLPIGLFYLLGAVLGWGVLGVWWGIVFINWTAVGITFLYTNAALRNAFDS